LSFLHDIVPNTAAMAAIIRNPFLIIEIELKC